MIDLGDEVKLDVRYKGQVYAVREPTVSEIESLESGDKMNVTDFLVQLGMPRDVVLTMGVSKARALIEGITEVVTKKK
jgi:hypothetical protein